MSLRAPDLTDTGGPFLFPAARTETRQPDTLDLEGPFELGEVGVSPARSAPDVGSEAPAVGSSCPAEVAEVIHGWGQYQDTVERLPQAERDKISRIADLVVASFTTPGCVPLGQITVVGHADKDAHGAAFEKKVSDERAQSVAA